MSSKIVSASSIKKGSFIVLEGAACKVVDATTSKSGKHGHAKIRIVAIGLIDEKKRDFVFPGGDNVEVPIIEKKSAQVLSIEGTTANVMDMETYENFAIEIPEELKEKVVENTQVVYWQILGQRVMKQLKGGTDEE